MQYAILPLLLLFATLLTSSAGLAPAAADISFDSMGDLLQYDNPYYNTTT